MRCTAARSVYVSYMPSREYQAEARVLMQRCLACGEAVDFEESLMVECDQCGCDFLDRPPRSYAEMEGIDSPVEIVSPTVHAWTTWREQMLVERWLWFLFGLGLLVVVAMLAFLP